MLWASASTKTRNLPRPWDDTYSRLREHRSAGRSGGTQTENGEFAGMRYDHCQSCWRGIERPGAARCDRHEGSARVARWKPLSASLDPAVVRFVAQLRQLKDDSRLTLPRLAAKTGFSASSWERYLGGRALAPFPAVEALVAIVGGDQVRTTALYEAAADAWRSQESDTAASVSQPEEPDDESRREPPAEPAVKLAGGLPSRRFLRTALTASAGAVAGAAITLLAVEPIHASTKAAPAQQALLVTKRVAYTCTYTRIQNGQWYAGNSTTSTDVLEVDMWGPEVAELQCLLQRAGISPGGIDGHFGPLTEAAVIKEQKALQLDIDGQVGPHTWAALRK